jgi:hypothetical protein
MQNRKILYQILKHTPIEKLVTIPQGFRNNIWWNIAHTVVTQQLIVYSFSGLPMQVTEDMVTAYRKGSVPTGSPGSGEIDALRGLLFSTIERTSEDYKNGRFNHYDSYTTSAKVSLDNVKDAIAFNVYHEGLHLGVILSLQKALGL